MNTLEKVRFVTKDFLQSLKNSDIKSETEELDFKEIFKISDTSSKVEFIKDFLAFANSKGGHIVFGVNKWHIADATGVAAPVGTIMLAALMILLGFQLILAFLAYDSASIPRISISDRLSGLRRPV